MAYRDHQPITFERFNGLWKRGNPEDTPLDHFSDCNNLTSYGQYGFQTRDGVGLHQDILTPLANIKRLYNYPTDTGNTLIVLTYDGTTGNVYHVVNSTTMHGPILTIVGMEDIGFATYASRAYITPFKTFVVNGLNVEKGLELEFVYVYLGDGTSARKAAGTPPAGTLVVANGAAGHTDAGVHVFGVVGETNTGYLSPPVAMEDFVTSPALSVSFSSIPVFVGAFWTKRHIVASKVVTGFNGDVNGYQLFFIPGATINDNVTTVLPDISFYDQDLLLDASHLSDNFSEIKAGVGLTIYHTRLVVYGQFANPSVLYLSNPGEPEAFNQIEGLLTFPPDGNPVTNAMELRDVLYAFKRVKTGAWADNGGVPTTWAYNSVDDSLGTPVHGIATNLDTGSAAADFLIIATYRGICLFNGRYILPEITYKMQDFWYEMDRNEFRKIQMINDMITQRVYCITTDRQLIVGDYKNGLDPKSIKWWPWTFDFLINTIGIVNIDDFIIGADQI